ncbi:MAG TPA: polymer-forming cytoskeletal protein [Chitinophagaceae bacterium]
MFNKEKNGTMDRTNGNSATLISAGTTLTGDITSDNDLRIDGTIRGNVYSTAKIIIGSTGFVEGNIDGQQADITGKVQGNITVKELLQLKGQCNVQGNITAEKLQIDPSATFNGQCQMAGKSSTATVQKKKNEQLAEAKAN